jgi:Uma2 family endonuclease
MPAIVHDQDLTEQILEQRHALGNRTHDECWDGVTHIMPLPDNEHEKIAMFFGTVFSIAFGLDRPNTVQGSGNLSDRVKGWKKNFRNPDMVYYSAQTKAEDHGTFWCGGPDFLLEIISPNDLSRDKLPFYAKLGTREMLILDRDPWQLELYELQNDRMQLTGVARPGHKSAIKSGVVPLSFALIRHRPRPKIRITHTETGQEWTF